MSASSVRAVTMMIGSSRVRGSARSCAREREAGLAGQHPVEQHEVGQRAVEALVRGLGVTAASTS